MVFVLIERVWRAILISGEYHCHKRGFEAQTLDPVSSKGGQDLSRRAVIVLISVLILVMGIEVAVRLSRNSRTGVEIANLGATAIENLVVSFGGSQVSIGHVAPVTRRMSG